MTAENLYRLAWMSRPLMQTVEACVEQGLAKTELTVRMRAVLEILIKNGELPVPEIANKLYIKRQYVQIMVNETIASGFTIQKYNPRHKRSPLIALTESGKELIDYTIKEEMRLMEKIASEFDDQNISIAVQVVLCLNQKLKEVTHT